VRKRHLNGLTFKQWLQDKNNVYIFSVRVNKRRPLVQEIGMFNQLCEGSICPSLVKYIAMFVRTGDIVPYMLQQTQLVKKQITFIQNKILDKVLPFFQQYNLIFI